MTACSTPDTSLAPFDNANQILKKFRNTTQWFFKFTQELLKNTLPKKKKILPNIFIKFLKLNFNSKNKTKSFVASVIQPADHAHKLPH